MPGSVNIVEALGAPTIPASQDFAVVVVGCSTTSPLDAGLMSACFNLGEVYVKLGDFAAASRNYEKALPLSPRSMKTYIYDKLAHAYLLQKQYSLSLRAIEKALEFAPNDPALLQHLQSRRETVMRAAESARP